MRHRLAILSVALLVLVLAAPAWAAGSITVTRTDVGASIVRYTLAWTCDASGAVSGQQLNIRSGHIAFVKFVPGAGGSQPTDLYDAQLQDGNDVDLLNDGTTAAGSNLSNATSKILALWPPPYYDASASLELVISNAGNAKTGTVYIYVAP